jgi:polyisoprenoid-binding protein YceI
LGLNRNYKAAFFVLLACAPALCAQENSWTIAPLDSFANFSVRHLMISTVHGTLGGLKGSVIYDSKDPSKDSVDATIDVNTFSSGVTKRDDQVKEDYFDVKKFPVIAFKSTKVVRSGAGKLKMIGNLTIKGTTRQVVLDIDGPSGMVKDAQGRSKVGLTATTKISRKDYGIVGTALDGAIEGGGIIVADEVSIELDIELLPNTPAATPAKTN